MTIPTTQADRIERSLRRLGFQLGRKGRAFRITDQAGGVATESAPAMTLNEVELWIGNHVKSQKKAKLTKG